jgi:methylase of polypeptide subunit release factors
LPADGGYETLSIGGIEVRLFLGRGIYRPDAWTDAFLAGLSQHIRERGAPEVLIEVGVGSGIAPIYLALAVDVPLERYIGFDWNPATCSVAQHNIDALVGPGRYQLICGDYLLARLPNFVTHRRSLIFANLPQVPVIESSEIDLANYYDVGAISHAPSIFSTSGLGLIYDLLWECRSKLAPGTSIILTLAERCGRRLLYQLFASLGAAFEILRTKRIPLESAAIDLPAFQAIERTIGIPFEFYAGETSGIRLNATDGARIVAEGGEIFFDLHVVRTRFDTSQPDNQQLRPSPHG